MFSYYFRYLVMDLMIMKNQLIYRIMNSMYSFQIDRVIDLLIVEYNELFQEQFQSVLMLVFVLMLVKVIFNFFNSIFVIFTFLDEVRVIYLMINEEDKSRQEKCV